MGRLVECGCGGSGGVGYPLYTECNQCNNNHLFTAHTDQAPTHFHRKKHNSVRRIITFSNLVLHKISAPSELISVNNPDSKQVGMLRKM